MPGCAPSNGSSPAKKKEHPKRHRSDDDFAGTMMVRPEPAGGPSSSSSSSSSPARNNNNDGNNGSPARRGRLRKGGNNNNESKYATETYQALSIIIRLLFFVCVVNTCWMATVSMDPGVGSFETAPPRQAHLVRPAVPSNESARGERVLRVEEKVPPLVSAVDDDDSVTVVLVSNRFDGIVATVSSILVTTTSRGVDLVIIGDADINEMVRQRFVQTQGNRTRVLHSFTSLTVHDVEADLVRQGHFPIWLWDEWHSSMTRDDWYRPNATLHAAEWDHLQTHAHKLNHLRFYLPYLSLFRNQAYIFFVDDDILIRKDLALIARTTLPTLPNHKAIVTPCNIWMWDKTCQRFAFLNETTIGSILEMPSLYGDRQMCRDESETHCYPAPYQDFLHRVLPAATTDNPQPEKQSAWNFGFSLFQLTHWKQEGLTAQYEAVMKASYAEHVFPETSLSFGLGVAYLAFAGSVDCWDDSKVRVRDGFGFIEHSRFEKSFGVDFIDAVDVIHYTGPIKPWKPKTTIEASSLEPWLAVLANEDYPIPEQLPLTPSTEVFVVLVGERTGTQWLMDAVDHHPAICAGENGRPETGFSPDSLMPRKLDWLPLCSTRRSCSFEFIYNAVLDLQATMDRRGRYALYPIRCQQQNVQRDELKDHLPRICNFIKTLHGNFSDAAIEDLWIDAYRREDDRLIGCSCPRGTKVKGLKVLSEWMASDDRPNALTLKALRNSKVIRMKRSNLVDRYVSQEVAIKTGMYKVTTHGEHEDQIRKLGAIQLVPKTMIETIGKWEKDDENADRWAKMNGSEVLELDYEECMADPGVCIERVCSFLGISSGDLPVKTNQRTFRRAALFSYMDFISNKDDIRTALSSSNFSEYISDW
jgi:LPS sulfotransferase NodH/lipopolysaccharide biosynthesis glycosyltransferase